MAAYGARKKELEAAMKDLVGDQERVYCAGVRISRYDVAGRLDYKKIPELEGIDLDQYRSAPSQRWSFKDE